MRRAGERSAIVVVVLLASAGACRQYGDEDAPAPASSSSYVDAASDPGTVDASGAGDDVQPELDAGPTTPSGDGGAREAGSDAAAPRDLYVFATSTIMDGLIDTLHPQVKANEICNTVAKTGPLLQGRQFVAWLAYQGTGPADFLIPKVRGRRYLRLDREVVTTTPERMLEDGLLAPIAVDELARVVAATAEVWSGTFRSSAGASASCENWSSESGTGFGMTGLVGATNIAWSQSGLGACSELRHLYCFEVP
ncbi:MAG: hypothetical protein U0270_37735 [Labilithrix sp.]